eukprot:1231570-Amorphochlora_amoeboformis.AAC.3
MTRYSGERKYAMGFCGPYTMNEGVFSWYLHHTFVHAAYDIRDLHVQLRVATHSNRGAKLSSTLEYG